MSDFWAGAIAAGVPFLMISFFLFMQNQDLRRDVARLKEERAKNRLRSQVQNALGQIRNWLWDDLIVRAKKYDYVLPIVVMGDLKREDKCRIILIDDRREPGDSGNPLLPNEGIVRLDFQLDDEYPIVVTYPSGTQRYYRADEGGVAALKEALREYMQMYHERPRLFRQHS